MKRLWIIPLLAIISVGCQTTSYQGKFGPRATALGETVKPPFEQMVANAKQEDMLLGSVYFQYDNAELLPESKEQLQSIAQMANQRSGQVVIEGHADHFNSEEFNMRLGYERALAVADYLKSAGVWDERMVVKSFGERRPIASNLSDDTRALNRRVEIKMFAQGSGMRGDDAVRVREKSLTKGVKKAPAMPTLGLFSLSPTPAGGDQ